MSGTVDTQPEHEIVADVDLPFFVWEVLSMDWWSWCLDLELDAWERYGAVTGTFTFHLTIQLPRLSMDIIIIQQTYSYTTVKEHQSEKMNTTSLESRMYKLIVHSYYTICISLGTLMHSFSVFIDVFLHSVRHRNGSFMVRNHDF